MYPGTRKCLKIVAKLLLLLLAVFVVSAGCITCSYHRYHPEDPQVTDDPELRGYFRESYAGSRRAFLAAAATIQSTWPNATLTSLPVASETHDDLFIDILHVPSLSEKQRLLVLSSGVHGAEGFVGGAVQRMFLGRFLNEELLQGTGVLLVHAVNPYGFKNCRRVNQNNVDLNRNCNGDTAVYGTKNADYSSVQGLVNPGSPVDPGSAGNVFFPVRVLARVARMSKASFRQGVMGGQYEHPKGIVYGGKALEPQIRDLGGVLKPQLDAYPLVMNIDLHTGHGERGTLHLFGKPGTGVVETSLLEDVFGDERIDWPGTGGFYRVTGDFSGFLGTLKEGGTYLPMTFEYGTMNSADDLLGGIKALHLLALENQGFHFGYVSPADEGAVKDEFKELFCPSSTAWRTKIMKDTEDLLEASLKRFGATSHSKP